MISMLNLKGSNLSLRVKTQGNPNREKIVLVHGVGARLENWESVATFLEKEYFVVSFDLRGHGGSNKPHEEYSLEIFVKDLNNLVDQLNITKFYLAGHSLGGMIAKKYTLDYPHRVQRLAVLSSACGRTDEQKAAVASRIELIANGIEGSHFATSVDRWFTPEFIEKNPELIKAYAERNAQNDPFCYASAYRVLAGTDLIDVVQKINRPTLIATGEFDRGSSPSMAKTMHEKIEGSKLVIIPKLRHSILVEAPELIANLLKDFFNSRVSSLEGVNYEKG
jgi:pimeloyl-ACP methyl ester carboxylesterase